MHTQQSTLEYLETLPLFRGLPMDDIATLAKDATFTEYRAGELIVGEDAKIKGLHLVVSGSVKLYKVLPEGKMQTIYLFQPGEPFCLCSAFREGRYPANAGALTDTRICFISVGAIEEATMATPSMCFNMLTVLSRRLKEAMERIESLSTRDISRRLALFLCRHPRDAEGASTLAMSHRELANVLGATPEALSRAFRKLSEAELAQHQGRTVLISSPEALEQYALGQPHP